MRSLSRSGRLIGAAALTIVVAACGSGGDNGGGGGGNPQDTPNPSATAATEYLNVPTLPPLGTAGPPSIRIESAGIGNYLVGPTGMALYIRTKDAKNSSSCTGSCATAWPPLTVTAGETIEEGPGVKGTLGSFKRADGSMQETINGVPLYYYSGDTAEGQINGQGLQGVWFLATSDGGHLSGGAAGSAAPSSGNGY